MTFLTKEQIIALHSLCIEQSGGSCGIRDEGLLDSAINAPFQSFAGVDLYPTVQSKAAQLCFGLINNHPFIDGNKRIGILAMLTFLYLNGLTIDTSDDEIASLGLSIASGKMTSLEITDWIIENIKF